MKWHLYQRFVESMRSHPQVARKYQLDKRAHRYALLKNVGGLEAMIAKNHHTGWLLVDALIADVLRRSAELSVSTKKRICLGLYIGGKDIDTMDLETAGLEALWTLPLRMDADVFGKRPVLAAFNKQLSGWFKGLRLGTLKDVEHGPLLCVAWMDPMQRQGLMDIIERNEAKDDAIKDPQKMMGARYLLGCEPSSWDDYDYLMASHGIQRWLERLFFQVSPHKCTWISRSNPLLGEWFADYWAASHDVLCRDDVRANMLDALHAMTFSVDQWYAWWSWHWLVSSPTRRQPSAWSRTPLSMGKNGTFRMGREPLSRPHGQPSIDSDIVAEMQAKHPEMAQAYQHWAGVAACTLDPDAGDARWVERMWSMHRASQCGDVGDILDVEGLVQG